MDIDSIIQLRGLKILSNFLELNEFLIHANLNRRDTANAFQNLC